MYGKLTGDDLTQIADLHYRSLSAGLLALLGRKFLILLYTQIYLSRNAVIFVHREDGKVVGFVAGGCGLKEIYFGLLKRPFRLLYLLSPILFRPDVVIKIFLIFSRKSIFSSSQFYSIEAELYSIVVNKDYWGKGISEELYKKLCNYFVDQKFDAFIIVVGDNLGRAKKFYFKQGAVPIASLMQGKGKSSTVFKHSLNV